MKKAIAVLLALSLPSCVFHRVDVQPVDIRAPVAVSSPVKAHLNDGSTVVYPVGVTVTADALVGRGTRYTLAGFVETTIDRVPLADVLGMETYRTRVNVGPTIFVTALAATGALFGAAALSVAIFGSCPTVYSADGAVEEAELFSSSIAPLFEGRDIDRLQAQADAAGTVSLNIRNEAMETHYINHLQLVEVRHARDEMVIPDAQGTPVVVGHVAPPASVRTSEDIDDHIDLVVPVDDSPATAAIVFRMRNSLLSTTLLYDVMLAPTGAAALDWLGEGLGRISRAVELGRWHQKRAGLHVAVWQDGAYKEVARVPDSGRVFLVSGR